ncbi:MAG: hypothetical protein FIB08_16030 [Candidatus Methanoperedens sp.]|nr:hypothetical protein [Candidatus Methanoperedens sp.]
MTTIDKITAVPDQYHSRQRSLGEFGIPVQTIPHQPTPASYIDIIQDGKKAPLDVSFIPAWLFLPVF